LSYTFLKEIRKTQLGFLVSITTQLNS